MKASNLTKPSIKAPVEKDLLKARAREQVSQRKLDRLKERFEKLQAELEAQSARQVAEREKWEARLAKQELAKKKLSERCETLKDEAAMWKSQLFEQMDRLEVQQADSLSVRTELAEAQWQLVELVEAERSQREIELAKSQAEVYELRKELTSSRAQVEGLRNVGTCLAANLEKAVAQRKVLQREHIRLTELSDQRLRLLEQRDSELETLKAALFEARGQILTHRLDSESWPALKAGLEEPEHSETLADWDSTTLTSSRKRRPLKLAAMPHEASLASPVGARQLLHRAGKTVGGWFKLGKS